MHRIIYEAAEEQVEAVSVFLMMILEYAHDIGLWGILSKVQVKMKGVLYSPLNKAQTIIAS